MTELYCVFHRDGLDYDGKHMFNLIAVCATIEKCHEIINQQHIERRFSGEPIAKIGTRIEFNDRIWMTHVIEKVTMDALFIKDLINLICYLQIITSIKSSYYSLTTPRFC